MTGAPRRSQQTTFVISVAAELAGMHPQTLRQYDRLGLVTPERTKGRGRRYTQRHVELLREVQRLSQDEGINLAGIQQILELRNKVDALLAQRDQLRQRVAELENRSTRVFAATPTGEVRQFQRGQRLPREAFTRAASPAEVVVWQGASSAGGAGWAGAGWGGVAPRPRVRAVIESAHGGVRVIDGEISTTVR